MTVKTASVRDFISFGILHPKDTFRYVLANQNLRKQIISKYSRERQTKRIAEVTDASPSTVEAFLREAELDVLCENAKKSITSLGRSSGQISSPEALYAICRIKQPIRIVETGIAAGLSSAFILEALRKNGRGQLYSIDMPNYEEELAKRNVPNYNPASPGVLPPGLTTGWAVPKELRPNWVIEIGLASEKLHKLLDELKDIDMFLHDSEHTYANMLWEYVTAWEFLRSDGILLSHDVTWNTAFSDFARKIRHKPVMIGEIGALRKD